MLPPLRHRREDIVPLAFAALAEDGYRGSCLTTEVVAMLLLHPWPWNIRELNHVVRWCAARLGTGQELDPAALERRLDETRTDESEEPEGQRATSPKPLILIGGGQERASEGGKITTPPGRRQRRPAPSREEVQAALQRSGGNVSAAARDLGRQRPLLYRLIERFGLKRRPSRIEDNES